MDILTHPGDKLIVDIEEIAKAAEKNNVILEINDSHTHLNTDEINICKNYEVKFAINSDSHIKDTVGSFESGLERAINAELDLEKIINLKI